MKFDNTGKKIIPYHEENLTYCSYCLRRIIYR